MIHSIALAVCSLGLCFAPVLPESAPEAETSQSVSSETSSEATSFEDVTWDDIEADITSSDWWKGVFATFVSFLGAISASLIGLMIALIRTKISKSALNAKYVNDVKSIISDINAKSDKDKAEIVAKMDSVLKSTCEALRKAGLEKEAAELLASTSTIGQVKKDLGAK
ncbi:MAG: hypothetical protein WCS90_06245 [Bacilli bacterium]